MTVTEAVGDIVAAVAARCAAAELGLPRTDDAAPVTPRGVRVAAVGTTAAHALGSSMLAEALARQGLHQASASAYASVPDLLAGGSTWDLALVLSPFKPEVRHFDVRLSPSAAHTGIVDTVVALGSGLMALNTNSWALAGALAAARRGEPPSRVLLLGAGATARSAVLGLRRQWPDCPITVSARRAEAARSFAEEWNIDAAEADSTRDVLADVVLHSTTWGETAESEDRDLAFPIDALLRPGVLYFDLNNRLSSLQTRALAAGCVVMSGTLMQRMTHACRASTARRSVQERDDEHA